MNIKNIFAIIIVCSFGMMGASEVLIPFLNHFQRKGKLSAIVVHNPEHRYEKTIVLFNNNKHGSSQPITTLPKDAHDPQFTLNNNGQSLVFECQKKSLALFDKEECEDGYTFVNICFYLNDGLRESYRENFFPSMKMGEAGNLLYFARGFYSSENNQSSFYPIQRYWRKSNAKIFLPKDTTPFSWCVCSQSIAQVLSPKIKSSLSVPFPLPPTIARTLLTSPDMNQVRNRPEEQEHDMRHSTVLTALDIQSQPSHKCINAIVESKYFGKWQREQSAPEYALQATLSTQDTYEQGARAEGRVGFGRYKEIILYKGDELWIRMDIMNSTHKSVFKHEMIGRCLSKDDCKILSATWSNKRLLDDEILFIMCEKCQYTHFDGKSGRIIGKASFTLHLKIAPEVRRAIEKKAQEGEINLLRSENKDQLPGSSVDQPVETMIPIQDNTVVINASHVPTIFSNRIFIGGITCFCAFLIFVLYKQGMLTYNFA